MEHVYVVSTQSKIDYDFSVEDIRHGGFRSFDHALERLKEIVEAFKKKHQKDFEKYSDAELYPDEDSGALVITEDFEDGYWSCRFGYQEDYECHIIYIDKIAIED